ncbi:MAG: TetR/AcrR family transcriptional regulator [Rhodobacteraceae bacterium]|nr:TetR/AcrR family transcriptional regulator [Paracoccaceae bacterium]
MTELAKSEKTRNTILKAGRELVLAKGFSGVGLKDILSACGVPKGSFYYYFESKERFGCELIEDYIEEYLATFERITAAEPTGAGKLFSYLGHALPAEGRSPMCERCLVVKLAAEVSDISEPMRQALSGGVDEITRRLGNVLDLGRRDGSLTLSGDPLVAAKDLYARWVGAAVLAKLDLSIQPLEQALRDTRERFAT